jgi:putative polyketide hydroxylase
VEQISTPVLIVGGSLVGLSAAVFLSWQGVPVIVVERHVESSPHPRAIGYTARTMELFRAVGIVEKIPQIPPSFRLRRARVVSLAGRVIEETDWTPDKNARDQTADRKAELEYSPYPGAAMAQDTLEPLLRDKAVELGADLRQGTELLSLEQDATGVIARVRQRDGGKEYEVRAQYLVGADGAGSSIREALRIPRKGRGLIRIVRSVLFRASLDEYLASGISQFEIEQPDLKAFLTTYRDGRWVLMFTDDIDRDAETLKACVYKATGRNDLEFEILTTGRWELAALVADHYDCGRVFLAGDAAHALPPTRGGYGANTGIEDAHNLAWKLAAVLSGKSTPELLATYSAERQPIGWLRLQQTFARPDYAADSRGIADGVKILDEMAMELGQLYRSSAVIGAGEDLPPARKPDEWAGQPGTRAQHLWITKDGERISTLDILQKHWTVLSEDERWKVAAGEARIRLAVNVEGIRVGEDVKFSYPHAFESAFGVGSLGASLVRPDGYIAWRTREMPPNPSQTLIETLAQVSSAARWYVAAEVI